MFHVMMAQGRWSLCLMVRAMHVTCAISIQCDQWSGFRNVESEGWGILWNLKFMQGLQGSRVSHDYWLLSILRTAITCHVTCNVVQLIWFPWGLIINSWPMLPHAGLWNVPGLPVHYLQPQPLCFVMTPTPTMMMTLSLTTLLQDHSLAFDMSCHMCQSSVRVIGVWYGPFGWWNIKAQNFSSSWI